MNSQISFIYFDLGGVIINNTQAIESIAREVQKETQDVQQFFDENWREACLGLLTNETYLARFKERFSVDQPTDLVEYFTDRQGVYQETHDFIHELTKNYRLGILSNAENGIIQTLLRKNKIPNINWDVIIESAQHGLVKPDPNIYKLAEGLAAVRPEEILFVDDRAPNIDAAKSQGWHAEVFDYTHVTRSIRRLKEILTESV